MLMNTSQLVTRATLHNTLGIKLAHRSVRSADTHTRKPRNYNDGQLGVTIDKNLKFSSPVSTTCCKANSRAILFLKCFYSKDTLSISVTLLSAFKTYVKTVVEYSSVVWNPFLIKDVSTLL